MSSHQRQCFCRCPEVLRRPRAVLPNGGVYLWQVREGTASTPGRVGLLFDPAVPDGASRTLGYRTLPQGRQASTRPGVCRADLENGLWRSDLWPTLFAVAAQGPWHL